MRSKANWPRVVNLVSRPEQQCVPQNSKKKNPRIFYPLIFFQTVAKTAALDRLTDVSKYGGTHKNRFGSDGKGRGKEGRVDASPARFRETK